ncbi:leucyl aminopeptidase [unidentified bacterial endosymbiont]|uniref:leucyl aminopeptidase n=1 Tax=unidentified bacterial endosymbiont TaxID=2355 RepID=UPI0020A14C00|nr:leucyl aminopeptidase [unidentified bacterial endosymbiont]
MEFVVNVGQDQYPQTACRVVGVFESRQLSKTAEQFDTLSGGSITALLQQGALDGHLGQSLLLHQVPQLPFDRLLLVGCGKASELTEEHFRKIIQKALQCLNDTGSTSAVGFFTEWPVKQRSTYGVIRQTIEDVQQALYCFDQLKQEKPERSRPLNKLILPVATPAEIALGETAIAQGLAIANGVKQAKDLANMPPNLCHTVYLADQARQLAERFAPQMRTTVLDSTQMAALGMNAYLAVGQGSQYEPLMSIMTYDHHPDPQAKPIVLVGKGLTFDSGGISLKPGLAMDEMKYDMCGAAAVYGVMQAVAELQLPLKIIGIMAGCENMPGNKAYRPGDILTTLSGQTVEVLNTDAEGRLVLCDVLTYVERFEPELVIDVATLTGACVIALGHHISGLLSNHDPLAQELLKAAQQANDPLWQLPLAEQYQNQLKSNFADMANIGDRSAGTIVAGCFLSRFTRRYHWAHLDIAGTAWRSGKAKGATGRPVALLTQFLLNRAGMAIEA